MRVTRQGESWSLPKRTNGERAKVKRSADAESKEKVGAREGRKGVGEVEEDSDIVAGRGECAAEHGLLNGEDVEGAITVSTQASLVFVDNVVPVLAD